MPKDPGIMGGNMAAPSEKNINRPSHGAEEAAPKPSLSGGLSVSGYSEKPANRSDLTRDQA